MPYITVICSDPGPNKADLATEIMNAAAKNRDFGPGDVSVNFPEAFGQDGNIGIFVDGLFKKKERTPEWIELLLEDISWATVSYCVRNLPDINSVEIMLGKMYDPFGIEFYVFTERDVERARTEA